MIELEGANGYCFTFCGCEWRYMIALGEIPKFKECCPQKNGTLPVIKERPASLRYYRSLRNS
jgi:hypothetical protein